MFSSLNILSILRLSFLFSLSIISYSVKYFTGVLIYKDIPNPLYKTESIQTCFDNNCIYLFQTSYASLLMIYGILGVINSTFFGKKEFLIFSFLQSILSVLWGCVLHFMVPDEAYLSIEQKMIWSYSFYTFGVIFFVISILSLSSNEEVKEKKN